MGIGFAIPVNMVKSVIVAARQGGGDRQASLARRDAAKRDQGHRRQSRHRSPDRRAGGRRSPTMAPSSDAGLKRGDVIIAVDGQNVEDAAERRFPARRQASRRRGHALGPAQRPHAEPAAETRRGAGNSAARRPDHSSSRSPFQGAEVMNMSPAVAEELSLERRRRGRRRRFGRRRFDRGRSRRAKGRRRRRRQRPEDRNDARSGESLRRTRAALGSDDQTRRADDPHPAWRLTAKKWQGAMGSVLPIGARVGGLPLALFPWASPSRPASNLKPPCGRAAEPWRAPGGA